MFFTFIKCAAALLTLSALILVISLKVVQHNGEVFALTTSKQKNHLGQQQGLIVEDDQPASAAGDIRCNGNTQCAASPMGAAYCVNGFCECLPGFVREVYDVVARCKCPKGTTRYGNFCWKIAGFLGGQCEEDSTCTAPGSFCIQGTCKCHPDLKPWGGRCWDALELDSASQREHLTLLMCLIIAAGLILPLLVKSCSSHYRSRRSSLQNPYSNAMQVRLPSIRSSLNGELTDAERIMAEFAAASGDPAEIGSDGLPTRYIPENDKPPAYSDVLALVKSMEAEAMLRHLQSQLQKQQRSKRRASGFNSAGMGEPSISSAMAAPGSPMQGACAMAFTHPAPASDNLLLTRQHSELMMAEASAGEDKQDDDESITRKMEASDAESMNSSSTSLCDDLPSFTDAMASRRNSTAIFVGHDNFKDYMSPPAYVSNPASSESSSRSNSVEAAED